jgi:hypothetical protein
LAMVALLACTAWLVYRFGRHWLQGFPALVPPFVYLTSIPVVIHGGSFRSDSMLAPLLMAALVVFADPRNGWRRDLATGTLIGTAFAVTVKVALFAPLFAGLLLFRAWQGDSPIRERLKIVWLRATVVLGAAGLAAAVLLLLHSLTLTPGSAEPIGDFGVRVAQKTLLDVPWFAQVRFLAMYVDWQPLAWTLVTLGAAAALLRRRWDLASVALALLPIAVYRNSYSYFYVVMLAPVSILAGYAIQEAAALVAKFSQPALANVLTSILWAGLLLQGVIYLGRFGQDGQVNQAALLAGVHQVFAQPQNYIDRCGMVATFRKVNPFMSTWGMENYRSRNVPFMPRAIERERPAFVVVNTVALNPAFEGPYGLLEEDRRLIEKYYPPYWGPLRVAGGVASLESDEARQLRVPFAGHYRLFSDGPVLIDGVARPPGAIVEVPESGVMVQTQGQRGSRRHVALFIASAQRPPKTELPNVPIFDGL